MIIELLKITNKESTEYRFKRNGKFSYAALSPQKATIVLALYGFIIDELELPLKVTTYKFNAESKTSIAYELCKQIKQKYPEFYI